MMKRQGDGKERKSENKETILGLKEEKIRERRGWERERDTVHPTFTLYKITRRVLREGGRLIVCTATTNCLCPKYEEKTVRPLTVPNRQSLAVFCSFTGC